MKYDYDVIVLGAGSAGLPIINGANNFGLKTALIEKEKIGGDCLNFGCVPSKTLIKSAKMLHMIRNSKKYGIEHVEIKSSFKDIMKRLKETQGIIEKHENPEYFRKKGVDVYEGSPEFINNHTIRINNKEITGKKIVISTGSRANIPPIEGLKDIDYLTNVEIFSLEHLPKSMIILGAGPIGVEMGQTFSRFGTKVTIVDKSPHIMAREDEEVAKELQRLLEKEGITIETNASILEVGQEKSRKWVMVEKNGKKKELSADHILVSLGRRPNIEGLNLEAAGVDYTPRGIVVNKRLKTTARNIYAAGDVAGPYYFSHTAAHHAGVVFANLFFKFPAKVDYSVVPWTTFSDPELARAGLTEKEAKEKGITFEVAKFNFADLDRSITESDTDGFAKILISKGKIIGVHMLGSHAGDIFHQLILAMKQKISVQNVAKMIHVYPTHSEIVNRTLGKYFFKRIYSNRVKKIVQWLFRWL